MATINFSKLLVRVALAALCLSVFLSAHQTDAQVLYWDPEGTNTSGVGFYSTWDTTATWSTNSNLNTNLVSWSDGAIACFSAGNALPSNIVIFVNTTQDISGLYNGGLGVPGQPSLGFIGSGALNLLAGQVVVSTGSYATNAQIVETAFNLVLTGPGQLVLQGPGPDYLYGADTYSGGTQFGSAAPGSGTLVYFNKNNSFGTGPITFLGGTNALYGFYGVSISNEVDISGGSIALLGSIGSCSGPWNLLATPTIITSNQNATITGPLSGPGGLNVTGASELILAATNTYTGPTTISNGFLAISSSGSISNTPSITLIPGSAYSILDPGNGILSSNTTLISLGGMMGGPFSMNFGSQPIILSFTPTNFTGDSAHAPLIVEAPELILSNNNITITNAAAEPLGPGTYTVIYMQALAFACQVIGAPNPNITVLGAGIATNTVAFLTVTNNGNGYVNLIVSPQVTSPPQISAQSSSNAFQLTGSTVPGAAYWVQSATNLVPPITWSNIAVGAADSNGIIQYSITNLSTNSTAFYRLAFP